jgi:hypothetical protein
VWQNLKALQYIVFQEYYEKGEKLTGELQQEVSQLQ